MSKSFNLNSPLELESSVCTDDGAGGFDRSWSILGTLWGHVEPRSGRFINGETGEMTQIGYDVTVRGAPVGQSNRPMSGQRFRWGQRLLRIEAVTEADLNAHHLVCHCVEEVTP